MQGALVRSTTEGEDHTLTMTHFFFVLTLSHCPHTAVMLLIFSLFIARDYAKKIKKKVDFQLKKSDKLYKIRNKKSIN